MSTWTRRFYLVRPGLGVYRELPILRGPIPTETSAGNAPFDRPLPGLSVVTSPKSILRAGNRGRTKGKPPTAQLV